MTTPQTKVSPSAVNAPTGTRRSAYTSTPKAATTDRNSACWAPRLPWPKISQGQLVEKILGVSTCSPKLAYYTAPPGASFSSSFLWDAASPKGPGGAGSLPVGQAPYLQVAPVSLAGVAAPTGQFRRQFQRYDLPLCVPPQFLQCFITTNHEIITLEILK